VNWPDDFIDRVICGDALEVMRQMPDGCVDAVITDPPFGIGYQYNGTKEVADNPKEYWQWLEPRYHEVIRVLRAGGLLAMWQAQANFKHFWNWFGDNIHIYCAAKNFVQLRRIPINYAYEPVILRYKDGEPLRPLSPKRNLDFFVANNAKWVAQTDSLARQHPCPRPIDQMLELIDNFSLGTVLDPFCGAGTTLVAAKQLGRHWIGVDISPEYCEIARKRIGAVLL